MPRLLPPAAHRSLLVYRIFFPLVFLAMLPGLLLRMFRRGGFRENFGQRFGRFSPATCDCFRAGRWWWIHSISVGETSVALKLARELQRRDPELRIVISVTTTTGFALAAKSASERLEVIYNPIDLPSFVRAALDLIRPARLILVEGEAWPNLLAVCHESGIATTLVEARLSPRSERRLRAARFWIAPIFNLLDTILLPTDADVSRWRGLGIDSGRLRVTGSIKFDTAGDPPLQRQDEFRRLLTGLGVPEDAPILVAGSTWDPEERTLVRLLRDLRPEFPHLLLVLVPRHVERTPKLLADLAVFGLEIARRTALPIASPAHPPDVLIVDTTGELREWYALGTIAFVGKSLPGVAQVGGQNPVEPASLGRATIAGPHMENFRAVMSLLTEADGICPIASESELRATIAALLRDPVARSARAIGAQTALEHHRTATARAAEHLLSPG